MLKRIFLIAGAIIVLISLGLASYYWTHPATLPGQKPVIVTNTPTVTAEPIVSKVVAIFSIPQGALVTLDGQVIGTTPVKYIFPTLKTYHLQVTKDGYIPQVLDFIPNDSSLRLQLVAIATISSSSPIAIAPTALPQTSTPKSTSITPLGTTVPFPTPPDLRILSQPNYSYLYTAHPSPSSTTITPRPTTNTPTPTSKSTASPSEQQIEIYKALIAEYSGVHDFPPGDTIGEGTADEEGVIIENQWFYPAQLQDFVAFPIHFINNSNATCTLHATSSQGELTIGTVLGKEDLLFRAQAGTNETMHFWCTERPQVGMNVAIFS